MGVTLKRPAVAAVVAGVLTLAGLGLDGYLRHAAAPSDDLYFTGQLAIVYAPAAAILVTAALLQLTGYMRIAGWLAFVAAGWLTVITGEVLLGEGGTAFWFIPGCVATWIAWILIVSGPP